MISRGKSLGMAGHFFAVGINLSLPPPSSHPSDLPPALALLYNKQLSPPLTVLSSPTPSLPFKKALLSQNLSRCSSSSHHAPSIVAHPFLSPFPCCQPLLSWGVTSIVLRRITWLDIARAQLDASATIILGMLLKDVLSTTRIAVHLLRLHPLLLLSQSHL